MSSLFRSEVQAARARRLAGEVLLAQPLSTQILTAFIAAILGGVFVFAAFGTYSRTEHVPGLIVPAGGLSRVFAGNPGTVAAIFAEEGERVAAGQPVARISLEQAAGNGLGRISVASSEAQEKLVNDQMREARTGERLERERLAAQVSVLARERASIVHQSGLQRTIVESARASFVPLSAILEKGYVSKLEYEARRQAMLREEQSLRQLEQALAAKDSALLDARAALARLPADTAAKIAVLRGQSEALKQQKAEAAFERQSYLVAAPVSGRIAAVNTAAGRATLPGRPLFTVIPDGGSLLAEVFAPSRAIGFVKPGQPVRLMVDAFPYQRFGSIGGKVAAVSKTVLAPDELDSPIKVTEPVYRLRIRLDRSHVDAYGVRVPLQPGMTLAANIVLDRRSFLDWLLEPLRAVRNRS